MNAFETQQIYRTAIEQLRAERAEQAAKSATPAPPTPRKLAA